MAPDPLILAYVSDGQWLVIGVVGLTFIIRWIRNDTRFF